LFNFDAINNPPCPVSKQNFSAKISSILKIESFLKNILIKMKELHQKNRQKASLLHLGIKIVTTLYRWVNEWR